MTTLTTTHTWNVGPCTRWQVIHEESGASFVVSWSPLAGDFLVWNERTDNDIVRYARTMEAAMDDLRYAIEVGCADIHAPNPRVYR